MKTILQPVTVSALDFCLLSTKLIAFACVAITHWWQCKICNAVQILSRKFQKHWILRHAHHSVMTYWVKSTGLCKEQMLKIELHLFGFWSSADILATFLITATSLMSAKSKPGHTYSIPIQNIAWQALIVPCCVTHALTQHKLTDT